MDKYLDNTNLVQLIAKWKWHIAIITIVAALCGAIFSSSAFITPLYKSEAVVYPANIYPYSDESETEQMVQILNSKSIMDSVVAKFDLWNHYKIDRNDRYAITYLIGEYRDKVKITKTPYEAVSIEVLDKDPIYACDMAKSILNFYDAKLQLLHKTKQAEVLEMYEHQIQAKQHYIDSLKQHLSYISQEYDVFDYKSQTREVMKAYLAGSAKAKDMKDNMAKYGGEVIDLKARIEAEAEAFASMRLEYEQSYRFYNSNLTYSNIITEPFPADKKAYPIRWIVVALSGLAALILSIVAVFVIENRKKFAANK